MGERCRRCGESAHRYSPDHPQHGPQGRWDWQACVNSLLARAERAERERDRLRERSGRAEAALERIANNGCGIPGHAVAVGCGSDYEAAATLAALSADADADAEPGLCDIRCRYDDLHTGACLLPEDPEPSRAEGDEHAFAPVDTPDAVDPHTCHRCGEGRFHPSHLDPREGLDPDERLVSDREGDDGRNRAEQAAFRALAESTCGGWHSYHEPDCGRCSLPAAARIAVDAVYALWGDHA